MTKNQARNAIIAMRLGWTKCVCGDPECGAWFAPGASKDEPSLGVPDYSNDLNAIHEAEKTLTIEHYAAYEMALSKFVDASGRDSDIWHYVLCATAEQRAEAFLKTIDKWVENP